jgi:hypothetical protein
VTGVFLRFLNLNSESEELSALFRMRNEMNARNRRVVERNGNCGDHPTPQHTRFKPPNKSPKHGDTHPKDPSRALRVRVSLSGTPEDIWTSSSQRSPSPSYLINLKEFKNFCTFSPLSRSFPPTKY